MLVIRRIASAAWDSPLSIPFLLLGMALGYIILQSYLIAWLLLSPLQLLPDRRWKKPFITTAAVILATAFWASVILGGLIRSMNE